LLGSVLVSDLEDVGPDCSISFPIDKAGGPGLRFWMEPDPDSPDHFLLQIDYLTRLEQVPLILSECSVVHEFADDLNLCFVLDNPQYPFLRLALVFDLARELAHLEAPDESLPPIKVSREDDPDLMPMDQSTQSLDETRDLSGTRQRYFSLTAENVRALVGPLGLPEDIFGYWGEMPERSSGNVYRDLGYPDPEEALYRAERMLDLVVEIHRLQLSRSDTLARLELNDARYDALLGGQIDAFTQEELDELFQLLTSEQRQSSMPCNVAIDWKVMTKQMMRDLWDFLEQSFKPLQEPSLVRSRAKHPSSAVDAEAASPQDADALKHILDDPRYRWLPKPLADYNGKLYLILQARAPGAPPDEQPPAVTVLVDGQTIEVSEMDYTRDEHKLDLVLDAPLPQNYHLAISPSDDGRLTIDIRTLKESKK
jgi:hypothetical protein